MDRMPSGTSFCQESLAAKAKRTRYANVIMLMHDDDTDRMVVIESYHHSDTLMASLKR